MDAGKPPSVQIWLYNESIKQHLQTKSQLALQSVLRQIQICFSYANFLKFFAHIGQEIDSNCWSLANIYIQSKLQLKEKT